MRIRTASVVLTIAVASTTIATAASATPAVDVPIAEAGTIQASDLPSTFTESTPMTSREGVSGDTDDAMLRAARKIPQCRGFVDAFGGRPEGVTASADGAQHDSDTGEASSSVLVFATSAQAEQLYEPLSKPGLATCLDKLFADVMKESIADSAGSGVKFEKVVARVTPHSVPAVGDATADYQVKIAMKASMKEPGEKKARSVNLRMYGDLQFVRVGRAIAFYNFLGIGAPVDDVQQPAVQSASTRLAQSLGG